MLFAFSFAISIIGICFFLTSYADNFLCYYKVVRLKIFHVCVYTHKYLYIYVYIHRSTHVVYIRMAGNGWQVLFLIKVVTIVVLISLCRYSPKNKLALCLFY